MAAPVIHWFRRDLRLNDNTALDQAFRSGQPVLPLFIIDPQIVGSPYASEKRTSFWMRALHALAQRIADEGGALVIAAGDPVAVLMEVAAKTGAISLYANADYSPLATRRDQRVKAETGLHLHLAHDALLLPPGAVLKDDGSPYTVFTPFKRRWNELPKPQPVADIARGG
jgi:deoxyribodipyrimidine photo-lyase